VPDGDDLIAVIPMKPRYVGVGDLIYRDDDTLTTVLEREYLPGPRSWRFTVSQPVPPYRTEMVIRAWESLRVLPQT
jgi:hypothetical protein